jgi:transposase
MEAALIRNLISDEEWAFFEPFVVETGPLRGRPPADHRRTLDGIFWITRTGAPWRDLPCALGKWNSVYQQFRRWSVSGLWDVMLGALADSGSAPKLVQMIDSTVIRAHHQAAGAKGGLKTKLLAVRAAALRRRFTPAPTPKACPSASKSQPVKRMTPRPTTP